MSEVKPALTPEEWLAPRIMFRPGKAQGKAVWMDEGYGIEILTRPDSTRPHTIRPTKEDWACVFDGSWSVPLDAITRHKLAALALHQQPFGFTHEDVDLLREMALFKMASIEERRFGVTLESIASRIESLLPPRQP